MERIAELLTSYLCWEMMESGISQQIFDNNEFIDLQDAYKKRPSIATALVHVIHDWYQHLHNASIVA